MRFRVTAVAALATVAVLVAAAFVLLAVQRQRLTENLDDLLRQRVDDLELVLRDASLPPVLTSLDDIDTVAQVVRLDGTVISASAPIQGEPALADAPTTGERVRGVSRLAHERRPYRLVSRVVSTAGGPAVIHVAARLEDIVDSTRVLEASLLTAVPIVTLLLAALVWWLTGRALRPVELIRAEVARISSSQLDRRVPQPAGDDEIARLAGTMNDMLERVEGATSRQRQFVADASHELRSPLTRIRAELEVDLAHPESADLSATHRSMLEETIGLQRLVEDLLHLAGREADMVEMRREPVDLSDIVIAEARRLRAGGRLAVDLTGLSAVRIDGDHDQLMRAVRNLADNAARHADATVAFTLSQGTDRAVMTIADDGHGIPLDQQERVFERFARVDDARSSLDGGTGLGLAITRDIVERHGGSIRIEPDHRPGTKFVLTFPAEMGEI